MRSRNQRALFLLLICVLSTWPLRAALFSGEMVGAGPDVNTTLWTMWWYQQEWMGAAWGGHSDLFNFPMGGAGAILSPITATTWALLEPRFGPNAAGTWTTFSQIALFGAAMVWLAREVGLSRAASAVALLAVFCQRYLIYAPGETSVVGISALPIPIGLIALLRLQKGAPQRFWFALAVFCMALQPLENPYLTPVLPGVALLLLIKPIGRNRLGWTLVAGLLAIVATGLIHKGATTLAYESTRPSGFVGFGSWLWPAVERPWAAAHFNWFFWPPKTVWSEQAHLSVYAQGREYLGLSVLVLAAIGAKEFPKKAWPWIGFALIGVLLATGSNWMGFPGPFALLNGVCARLVRVLTQPTRFLILSTIGFSLAAAWGFEAIRRHSTRWAWIAGSILVADAFLLGGLSLKLPTMQVPTADCVVKLRNQPGGVLVWPWDGADHMNAEAPSKSRLLQVAHGKPGATIGTGSWPLTGRVFPGDFLRSMHWAEGFSGGTGKIDLKALADLGFQWMLVDMNAPEKLLGRPDQLFGSAVDTCPGYRVYRMPAQSAGVHGR
jgi:hypothetical protein